jgi:predicted DCC family thiol-disulfide oxidoreductase YuxK
MKPTISEKGSPGKGKVVATPDQVSFICQSRSVATETTEIDCTVEWVFYDGSCRYCAATARWFEPVLKRRGIRIAPLQAPWVLRRLGIGLDEAMKEMKFLDSTGLVCGGADGIIQLARRFWWGLPLLWISFLPGVMPVLRGGYSRLAAWRSCKRFGRCKVNEHHDSSGRAGGWGPLIVLPLVVAIGGRHWANWIFMWAMALAIFLGCKWLTWVKAGGIAASRSRRLVFGYFFAWPGMDARGFLGSDSLRHRTRTQSQHVEPASLPWLACGACLCFGAAMILDGARRAGVTPSLLAGWEGMIGLVLVLHFGVFKVLSLVWERRGVRAEPVMRVPLTSSSLTEFWGERWNTAFNSLVHQFAFIPLARGVGTRGAVIGVFLISGLIHELVISLPARGGYGLPTMYFLAQGIGVALERSRWGRRVGLGRGAIGRLFMIVFVAGPVFWLFHPLFVNRVIVPMLQVIGAI